MLGSFDLLAGISASNSKVRANNPDIEGEGQEVLRDVAA